MIKVRSYTTLGLIIDQNYNKLIQMGFKPIFVYYTNFGKFIDELFPKLSKILRVRKSKVEHVLKKGNIKVTIHFLSDINVVSIDSDGCFNLNVTRNNLDKAIKRIIQLEREDKLKRILKK